MSRRRSTLGVGLLVALLLMPVGRLAAAGSLLEPPDLALYRRWGPLRARPGLELVNAGYDDNILSSSTERVPDYRATLLGRLDGLLLLGSRAFVTFREELGYTAYREHTEQNFPLQHGTARVTAPFGRIGVFGEVVLNRDTERPVDRQDVRPDRREDGGALGLVLELGWRTSLELARRRTAWSYYDPDFTNLGGQTIAESLDRNERRMTLKVGYVLFGRTSLTLDADRGSIEFDSLDSQGRTKDSRAWSVLPGIKFAEGGPLSGVARLGWTEIASTDPSRADLAELIAETELAYHPVGATTIQLRARRTPGFTVTSASTFYVESRVGASVLHYVTRAVGLEGGATLGEVRIPAAAGLAERRDHTLRREAAVRLRVAEDSLGRRMEYRLSWEHLRQHSELDSQRLSRSTIGLNVVMGY